MSMRHVFVLGLTAATALTFGCAEGVPDGTLGTTAPGGRVAIDVAALSLSGVTNATYTLTVTNGATPPDTVWTRTIDADGFGDGAASVSYVGTCDATANPNTITITLDRLDDADGEIVASTWQNPTPLARTISCEENRDVAVDFNLTILRDAQQGFFDVAVDFADIFCSAKLDCLDGEGDPLALLHDPDGDGRGTTAVMALACTSGAGEPTWLHMNDVLVECADGARSWIDPSRGPGNTGGYGDALFQTAVYRGAEQLPGVEKCYWNLAIGLALGDGARGCTISGDATATPGALVGGRTPADTVYPYIHWEVALTDAAGALACGRHPVNVQNSGVSTRYSDVSGAGFTYSMACADTDSVSAPARTACGGDFAGNEAALVPTADGVQIAIGGDRSPSYRLPAGASADACCTNPCCAD